MVKGQSLRFAAELADYSQVVEKLPACQDARFLSSNASAHSDVM